MKSEYLKDAAKLVDLQSEVERLQGENEKLKNYLFQHLQYLKSTNVFHTHQSEINAIEKILNV